MVYKPDLSCKVVWSYRSTLRVQLSQKCLYDLQTTPNIRRTNIEIVQHWYDSSANNKHAKKSRRKLQVAKMQRATGREIVKGANEKGRRAASEESKSQNIVRGKQQRRDSREHHRMEKCRIIFLGDFSFAIFFWFFVFRSG